MEVQIRDRITYLRRINQESSPPDAKEEKDADQAPAHGASEGTAYMAGRK